jgi:hypothetical protein
MRTQALRCQDRSRTSVAAGRLCGRPLDRCNVSRALSATQSIRGADTLRGLLHACRGASVVACVLQKESISWRAISCYGGMGAPC